MLIDYDALKELDAVNELIDRSRLEKQLSGIHSKKQGEKAWHPLDIFKTLMLQSWRKLSDPALEKKLARDLLFHWFTGFDFAESVPDYSIFWRFRQTLEKLRLMDGLLTEINHQLSDQSLTIKLEEVSTIDASIIEAENSPPNKSKAEKSTQDPTANWNVKAGSDGDRKRKSTCGYKNHMNVDEYSFIKSIDYTTGNVHDSTCFTGLLSGNESAAYAGSAYHSQPHTGCLKGRRIHNRIIKRACRNRSLDKNAKQFNRIYSSVRCTLECVFDVLKQHYGMAKARYLGINRNRICFEMMYVAHNLKRGLSIQQSSCA